MKPSIRTIFLLLLLVAIAMLAFLQKGNAQFVYIVKPAIKEQVSDTIIYQVKNKKVVVYMLKDGDAWIEEESKVSYLSKSYFDKWRKVNKIQRHEKK